MPKRPGTRLKATTALLAGTAVWSGYRRHRAHRVAQHQQDANAAIVNRVWQRVGQGNES